MFIINYLKFLKISRFNSIKTFIKYIYSLNKRKLSLYILNKNKLNSFIYFIFYN